MGLHANVYVYTYIYIYNNKNNNNNNNNNIYIYIDMDTWVPRFQGSELSNVPELSRPHLLNIQSS